MSAKRFALVSFSVLCLMLSAAVGFHLGNRDAQAQGGAIVGFAPNLNSELHYVIDTNGDVWAQVAGDRTATGCMGDRDIKEYCMPPFYIGNFWTGQGPVGTSPSTFGNVKNKYGGGE